MKSSTYGFFIMLAFLSTLGGGKFTSITELMRTADSIARDMGCNPSLGYMTKYNVIRELKKKALVVLHKEKHYNSAVLESNVEDFVIHYSLAVEEKK